MTPWRRLVAALRRTRPSTRRLAAGVVAITAIAAAVAAMEPWATTSYDLDDSGVWIADGDRVGRLNTQIAEIDYVRDGIRTSLQQDGRHPYLVSRGATTTISRLDPADPGSDPEVALVDGEATVEVGGGVVAAMVDGEVERVGRGGSLGLTEDPVMDLGAGGVMAVGPGGTIAGYAPSTGRLHTVASDATAASTATLEPADDVDAVQITLVGDRPVVLDGDRLLLPGADPVDLGGPAVLQQPGPAAGEVVVATAEALLSVDLDGGSPTTVDDTGTGEPVRPAVRGRCTHGAWAGGTTGRLVVHCDGEEPLAEEIAAGGTWIFRAGGPTIVLNAAADGTAYLVLDGRIQKVTAWPEEEQRRSEAETIEETEPDPEQKPPVAVADVGDEALGARPGRVTLAPVLHNDYDPNGDPLVIGDLRTDDDRIAVGPDGRTVQVDLTGPDVDGPLRLRYRAYDGIALSAEWAEVEVRVVTDAGSAPRLNTGQRLTTTVEVGQEVVYDVLPAFWDPDGDPLYLAAAGTPSGGHVAIPESDGRLRFRAGGRTGSITVPVTVSDTFGQQTAATVVVTVGPVGGGLEPVLRNDVVMATTGRTTTFAPLANDHDPTGSGLAIEGQVGAKGTSDVAGLGPVAHDGTEVEITPEEAGDYVLSYAVEGATERTGTVLVRVSDPTQSPPVALPDVVLVESGRSTAGDLLRNDVDPDGTLLALTRLEELEVRGLDAADGPLADHLSSGIAGDLRTVVVDTRPSALPGLTAELTYEVSDGTLVGRSTVTIVVVPPQPNRAPQPVLPTPEVVARPGDVATVRLDALAWDPDGDPLLASIPDQPSVGEAAADGRSVRYFPPADAEPGTEVTVPVDVSEPSGSVQTTSFTVRISDPAEDRAPRAEDIEARVRAGGTVTIPIPLADLDPDGDWVRLSGRTDQGGIRGRVTEDTASQALVYEAVDATFLGEETLAYTVVDATGRESAPATVRILVTAVAENSPPTALTDRIVTRPGRQVQVDPLANDTDADGDPLALVDDSVEVLTGPCTVEVADGRVAATTTGGSAEGCTIAYAVVDADDEGGARSAPVPGRVAVETVAGFEGMRPIARDDHAELEGREATVRVDLLGNDDDPDGSPARLDVRLVGSPPGVTLDPSTGLLTARLTDTRRMVRYRITDRDGLTADAVARIPGRVDNRAPRLRGDAPTLSVRADQELVIDLDRHVEDPDGDLVTFSRATSAGADSGLLSSRLGEGVLVFRPTSRDRIGPATVHVTATDDAAEPLTSVVTLVVDVTSPENRPPEWTGSLRCPSVEQGAGGTPIELRSHASDLDLADDPRLTFSGGGSRRGVTATVTPGGRLSVRAANSARVGDAVGFTFTVEDPHGASDDVRCEVEVTASRAPALQATDGAAQADQGEPVTVDVADLVANAVDPLRIDAVTVEGGPGLATADGTSFTYTSPADHVGEVRVRYRVIDGLHQPASPRRSSAAVTITVRGRPDAPTAVVAAVSGSASVSVSWINGASNGSPTEGFVVEAVGGGARRRCVASPCVLTSAHGIENDVTYRFTVTAENDVGPSPASGPSNEVRPDTPPSPPTGMRATVVPSGSEGTGAVRFSWTASASDGSPVTGYELSTGHTTGPEQTEVLVSGRNGVEICASVVARNRADAPSAPSGTACATPYGRPVASGLTVTLADGRDRVVARWSEDGNGRPVTSRTVTGDCTTTSVEPGRAELTCSGRGPRRIEVAITNSEGLRSDPVATIVDVYEPPVVVGASIEAAHSAILVEARVDDGGAPPTRVVFELSTGSHTFDSPGPHVLPAEPWTTVELVRVTACRGDVCGPARDIGATATPWGDPPPPTDASIARDVGPGGTPTGTATITFTWSRPPGSGGTTFEVHVEPGAPGPDGTPVDGTNAVQVPVTDEGGTWTIRVDDATHGLRSSAVEVTLPPAGPGGG